MILDEFLNADDRMTRRGKIHVARVEFSAATGRPLRSFAYCGRGERIVSEEVARQIGRDGGLCAKCADLARI